MAKSLLSIKPALGLAVRYMEIAISSISKISGSTTMFK